MNSRAAVTDILSPQQEWKSEASVPISGEQGNKKNLRTHHCIFQTSPYSFTNFSNLHFPSFIAGTNQLVYLFTCSLFKDAQ
jgi:hypothetical protein